MKNQQELKAERSALLETFRATKTNEEAKALNEALNENDKQLKALQTAELLHRVNMEQARKREEAARVWECETPTEDITTADGSLHKVKARKYPKLAALDWVRLKYEGETVIEINGLRMVTWQDKTRPASFADFLELNNIQGEEITAEQFATFTAELNEANAEMKKAIETYKAKRDTLKVYKMQNIGLVGQSAEHLYTYTSNTR